jgi:hypothetical protein
MEWIEIFKAGKWTDMSGVERSFSEADLDTIVSKYNPAQREAPLVLGHPKHDAPAYGWVESLKREGGKLLAKVKQVSPAFAEWVKDGRYKKKSISVYPDFTLRHVGFLGAMQPAVPGLADGSFAERENPGEILSFEFGEAWWKFTAIGRLMQRFRDHIVEKEGLEKADAMLPQYEIDMLKEPPPEVAPGYAEGESPAPAPEPTPAPPTTAPEPAAPPANFSEENEGLRLRVAQLEAEKRQREHTTLLDQLVAKGRVLPGQMPAVLAFMEVAAGHGEYTFAEGKKPLLPEFMAFLSALPEQIKLTEEARGGEAAPDLADPIAISQRATEFMEAQAKQGNTYTASEAVQHVLNQGAPR